MHFPHSHPRRRRPTAIAALVSVAIAIATGSLLALAAATPAAAHTGDMTATAVCNTVTGEYDVTYALTLAQAAGKTGKISWRVGGQEFTGTPRSGAGMDRGPLDSNGNVTIALGVETLPGTTTGNGPWVYAFTAWNDGFGKGSDTRVEGLQGDCSNPLPEKPLPYADHGEWSRWTAECEARTATRSRSAVSVDWRWDEYRKTWVDDVRSTEATETETREATGEECPIPELPEDTVEYGNWSSPQVTCDSEVGDEVEITRTVKTTTYTWGEDGEPLAASFTRTDTGTYVVTQADVEGLSCPVTPPTEEPKPTTTETPAPTPESTGTLAQTGGTTSPALPIAGILAAAVGIGLLSLRARRS